LKTYSIRIRLFFLPIAPALILLAFPIASGAQAVDVSQLVKRVKPAVVTILVYNKAEHLYAQGSGFFIDSTDLVTCYHVLAGAMRAEYRDENNEVHEITGIVASYEDADLVKARVSTAYKGKGLKLARKMPEEGERVVAIGTPRGLELTVSDGIVSSIRTQPDHIKALQITAPISEGSSGGPVFNMKGEVVGIAAAQFHDAENLNFATPVEFLREMHDQDPTPLKVWSEGLIQEKTAGEEARGEDTKPELSPREKKEKQKFLTDYTMGRGIDYFNQKNYDKAIEMLRTAVTIDPANARAWIYCGESAAAKEDYNHAAQAFEQAAELLPRDPNPLYRLSDMLFHEGKYDAAILASRRVFLIDPHDGLALDRIGNCLAMVGHDSEAMDAFRTAIRLHPQLAEAHSMLGWLYATEHNKDAALEEYKILQGLDKKLAEDLWKKMSEP
jgi:tetratricopeptide (TPR) repeat protein